MNKEKKNMILTLEQICNIDKQTNEELLSVLYKIEDKLLYKCEKVSNTIDFLQKLLYRSEFYE